MKKYLVGFIIYTVIGAFVWQIGYIEAPTLKETIFSFLYVVFLWPIVIFPHVIFG